MSVFTKLTGFVEKINNKIDDMEMERIKKKERELNNLEVKARRKKIEYDLDRKIKKRKDELKEYTKDRWL